MTKRLLPILILPLLAALGGCSESPAAPLDAEMRASHAPSAGEGELLATVRHETRRFNSTAQAIRAGYAPDPHCVAHPQLGGMGHHWVNQGLIDPAFEPLRPEALLYAPDTGGALRLVAVEYIVLDMGQDHPHFDGHPFDVGGVPPLTAAGVPHWSLHVWVHRENPNGTFTPFNPDVSCD